MRRDGTAQRGVSITECRGLSLVAITPAAVAPVVSKSEVGASSTLAVQHNGNGQRGVSIIHNAIEPCYLMR